MFYKNPKYEDLLQKLAKFPLWEIEFKSEVKPKTKEIYILPDYGRLVSFQ